MSKNGKKNTSEVGQMSLSEHDPELFEMIEREKNRQWKGLELIASENFTSRAVMECLGSCLTNKYAEGYPGKRYYGGNQYIDQIESLCQERALSAYGLNNKEWGVNVQPYSGSPANFGVYTALLQPHDRIMGLDLPSGGHLTHGFYTTEKKAPGSKKGGGAKKISATSVYFESLPYRVNQKTGYLDYDQLKELANLFKPKLIVCGGSAYPREWDYKRFREIADEIDALLMVDMAHVSGLVATGFAASPFQYADIVTTTTHKSLRGPRAGMIFYKKDERDFESKIGWAIFPALQGGPHEHQIAAIATQLKEVQTPEFKAYAKQIISNSQTLAEYLISKGHQLATNGTDNHLILWDLRPLGLTGSKLELICERAHITLNKNAVPGDISAMTPGGVRVGTPALTSRGFKEADFKQVGEFLHRATEIAVKIQNSSGKALDAFRAALDKNPPELLQLEHDVVAFATKFPIPGFTIDEMKYTD